MLEALIAQCAAEVAPSTMAAIIQVESGGYPWVIGDNTLRKSTKFSTKAEAVVEAERRIALGHSLDLGLAQINNANLRKLKLSVAEVFEPCTNLAASAKILSAFYIKAADKFGYGQKALFHALSGYNTGSLYAGTPYVKLILAAAGRPQLPAMAVYSNPTPPGNAPRLAKTAYVERRSPVARQILVFPYTMTSPDVDGSDQTVSISHDPILYSE